MEWSEHFDIEAFEMLKEVMEDEFSDLLIIYIDDSEARFPKLRSALATGDASTLRELAHSFKGASSNISAVHLSELCYTLERAARDNDLQGLADVINRIEREFVLVKQFLQQHI